MDDRNVRRRFRASTMTSTTKIRPLVCTLPLKLAEGWNEIQINLIELTQRAYATHYVEATRLQVRCGHVNHLLNAYGDNKVICLLTLWSLSLPPFCRASKCIYGHCVKTAHNLARQHQNVDSAIVDGSLHLFFGKLWNFL